MASSPDLTAPLVFLLRCRDYQLEPRAGPVPGPCDMSPTPAAKLGVGSDNQTYLWGVAKSPWDPAWNGSTLPNSL